MIREREYTAKRKKLSKVRQNDMSQRHIKVNLTSGKKRRKTEQGEETLRQKRQKVVEHKQKQDTSLANLDKEDH